MTFLGIYKYCYKKISFLKCLMVVLRVSDFQKNLIDNQKIVYAIGGLFS